VSAEQDLREAYIEYGCAISSLLGMQSQPGAGKVDELLVGEVHWHADRGNQLAHRTGETLGFWWTPAVFQIETSVVDIALEGDSSLVNAKVVDLLQQARARLSVEMRSRNITVPDDLPRQNESEKAFGKKRKRQVLQIVGMLAIVALMLLPAMCA
jgi:hypothetical protein